MDVMAVLLDGIHEAVNRDGSLHRHAVLATDLRDDEVVLSVELEVLSEDRCHYRGFTVGVFGYRRSCGYS